MNGGTALVLLLLYRQSARNRPTDLGFCTTASPKRHLRLTDVDAKSYPTSLRISVSFFFFFLADVFRLLYTIFFLTKSAKKVRLLFLGGLEARRGFFGRNELKIEVSSLYCPGRVPGHRLVS